MIPEDRRAWYLVALLVDRGAGRVGESGDRLERRLPARGKCSRRRGIGDRGDLVDRVHVGQHRHADFAANLIEYGQGLVEPSQVNLLGRRSTEGWKCSLYFSRILELMPSATTMRSESANSSKASTSRWKRICTPATPGYSRAGSGAAEGEGLPGRAGRKLASGRLGPYIPMMR